MKFKLEICCSEEGHWMATSKLLNDGKTTSYIVFGDTLGDIREQVSRGIAGELGIPEIEFEEVFIKIDDKNHSSQITESECLAFQAN